MSILSDEFRGRLCELYGQRGQAFAASLPGLLERCETRFGISLKAAFSNLSWNLLVMATTHDGRDVVLKLGVLVDELSQEARVLAACQDYGAIGVLDFDEDLGALVLARATPGTPLSLEQDDDRATGIFCDVFARLHGDGEGAQGAQMPLVDCPTIMEHFAAIGRYQQRYPRGDGPLPATWVDFAAKTLTELVKSTSSSRLLHSDLHHDNILRHGADWVFIDPKGVQGDIHFDTIQYLLNYPTRGSEDAEVVLARRINIMSGRLGLDSRRIALWGVVRGVLEACWTLEETTDGIDGMLIASRFAAMLGPGFLLE